MEEMSSNKEIKFTINQTWNGKPIDHEAVEFSISTNSEGTFVKIDVKAPFFNDPGCPKAPVGPCDQLWDYEVAEVFFLGENDRYLELEFGPYNHYLVLLLEGQRNMFKDKLELSYTAHIDKEKMRWTGSALVPLEYFPPRVTKLNAFAIHGSDNNRVYEALYPSYNDKFPSPDFHRLELFKDFEFKTLFPVEWIEPKSSLWSQRIAAK